MKETIYRCPLECPWNKKCFVCKVKGVVIGEITILHKCSVSKQDVPVHLRTTK